MKDNVKYGVLLVFLSFLYIVFVATVGFGLLMLATFIPASIAYMVLVWGFDLDFPFWKVYWAVLVVVAVINIRVGTANK